MVTPLIFVINVNFLSSHSSQVSVGTTAVSKTEAAGDVNNLCVLYGLLFLEAVDSCLKTSAKELRIFKNLTRRNGLAQFTLIQEKYFQIYSNRL